MEKKFLPIGSVVRLKNGTKKVMVTGFCMVAKDDNDKMYDYVGCLYPVGMIASDKNLVFNHDQIEEIFFLGYTNIEEQDFKEKLNKELAKADNQEGSTEESKEEAVEEQNEDFGNIGEE